MLSNPPSSFRFIIYSAQILLPAQQTVESLSVKRRKTEHAQLTLTAQRQPKGLAHWIDQFTDWQFAVVNHEPNKIEPSASFRWCDDISTEHQHIIVHSNDNPKHMEKTIKSFIRHEGKVLNEIRARVFVPQSAFQTFNQQFLRFNVSEISRRGDIFEEFIRNTDSLVEDIPKRSQQMDLVWEIERSSPARRTEINTLTEYQKRLIAKIESLESTDSPFKDTIEAFVDILAAGWGSLYRTDHSMFIEVHCGLTNAQCSCWECWDAATEDEEIMEKTNDSPK